MLRILGLAMIVTASSAVGFGFAGGIRRQWVQLSALLGALGCMKSEILCRLTPIPELFSVLADYSEGAVGELFARCAAACRQNRCSPPSAVIKDALAGTPGLCLGPDARRALLELGMALGKFDMEGQCRAIGLAEARLQRELELLGQSRRARCRSYETIGVCAGLAIAVLLV